MEELAHAGPDGVHHLHVGCDFLHCLGRDLLERPCFDSPTGTVIGLYQLKIWRESEPEAPDGPWVKDFGVRGCGA